MSLREHDAFLDEKDDLVLMSMSIIDWLLRSNRFVSLSGLLLGFPLDDFASTLEPEACEARSLLNRLADIIVQEAVKDIRKPSSQEEISTSEAEEKQSELMKCQNLLKQFALNSGIERIVDVLFFYSILNVQIFGQFLFKFKNVIQYHQFALIFPVVCFHHRSISLPM